MTCDKRILKTITRDLVDWTVCGIFKTPVESPFWVPAEPDAAMKVPSGELTAAGQSMKTVKTRAENGVLDFRKIFGAQAVRTGAYAFAEAEFPESGALTLTWHADYWAALWMDGREILSLKKGSGTSLQCPVKTTVLIESGRHVFCARVMSGSAGWVSALRTENWSREIPDFLRADRSAKWRDYSRSAVRLEFRPPPDDNFEGLGMEKFETFCASAGVDARWIGLTDHIYGANFQSKNLPASKNAKPEYEEMFKTWIKYQREKRFSVITWVPLTLWGPAWEAHPDWRVKFLVDPPEGGESWGHNCCLNSPYKDALSRFCVECLQKFDLDGIWFDGAGLHGGAVPQAVGCVCPHCEKLFLKDTGRRIPVKYDWSDADFRAWVQWRYDNFAENWQYIVDFIHAAVPEASVAFNHYHRERAGWNGSIPLNPFGHNFISATEADYEPRRAAFYTRCMRAYERGNAETWMGLNAGKILTDRGEIDSPVRTIEFALGCCLAGGHPSMGGYTPHLRQIADEILLRAPYINNPESAAETAIHISQQTETFVFGRDPDFITPVWRDYYWASAVGWHNLISDSALPSDVIYDEHLTPEKLSKYKVLVMPLACALSAEQCDTVLNYVKKGGKLLTGPCFGVFDPEGEPHNIADKKLFKRNCAFPAWKNMADALYDSKVKFSKTKLGKGEIIQFGSDIGGMYRRTSSKKVLEVAGRHLKFDSVIEIVCEKNLHAGLFSRGHKETIVMIQCFDAAWESESPERRHPETRWGAKLIWRGGKPASVRTMIPAPGPSLPVKRRGKDWLIELPPMTWGQTMIIKED